MKKNSFSKFVRSVEDAIEDVGARLEAAVKEIGDRLVEVVDAEEKQAADEAEKEMAPEPDQPRYDLADEPAEEDDVPLQPPMTLYAKGEIVAVRGYRGMTFEIVDVFRKRKGGILYNVENINDDSQVLIVTANDMFRF